jgi:bifunctional oligoribonuclease and PAP phosphatase NrnA
MKSVTSRLSAFATERDALGRILAAGIDTRLAKAGWQLIEGASRILLLAHERPDPDALGSALGLAHALAPLGKDCVVACADPVPAHYTFLPGREQVVIRLPDERFDLVVALDAGELSRYGTLYERHRAFFDAATVLNIDHHVTSTGCGAVTIIDPVAAATAELLTLFLLNRGVAIDTDTADNLLAGIITDTRSFEFDATTPRTLAAGAYLVACGAVPERIVKPMYQMKPLAKARLWGRIMDRELRVAAGGRIAWAVVRQRDIVETGATPDMDDGLPSYLLDIDGVGIAALFKEQPDGTTKVSLRAAAPYDAAAIAARFGGGGHVRAAGFSAQGDPDTVAHEVVPALEAALRA